MGDFEKRFHKKRSIWEEKSSGVKNQRQSDVDKEFSFLTVQGRFSNPIYAKNTTSGKPEAVFKIVDGATGKTSVRNIMEYIARDAEYMGDDREGLTLKDEFGNEIKTKAEREKLLKEWSSDFISTDQLKKQSWKHEKLVNMKADRNRLSWMDEQGSLNEEEQAELASLNRQIKGQYFYNREGKKISLKMHATDDAKHMLFSVGGKDHKPKRAEEAFRRFAHEVFGEAGYRYTYVMHNDTDNLHFHLLLKNTNEISKEKVRFDKADLLCVRMEFTKHLERLGIQRSATLRKDRPQILKEVQKRTEALYKGQDIYEAQFKASSDKDEKSPYNAVLKKEKALETTVKMLKTAKSQKRLLGGKTNKALDKEIDSLNSLKDKLVKKHSPEEIESTLKFFAKENKSLYEKMDKALKNFKPSHNKVVYQKKVLDKHHEDIKKAVKIFQKQGTPQSKEAIKTLKELSKGRGKSK